MEGKFGHEPWPRMCGQINLKFYKKQTKSENHKICHDIIISKVETVGKKFGKVSHMLSSTLLTDRRNYGEDP